MGRMSKVCPKMHFPIKEGNWERQTLNWFLLLLFVSYLWVVVWHLILTHHGLMHQKMAYTHSDHLQHENLPMEIKCLIFLKVKEDLPLINVADWLRGRIGHVVRWSENSFLNLRVKQSFWGTWKAIFEANKVPLNQFTLVKNWLDCRWKSKIH